ncbi:MAG: tyrosine-type recombinase/integrase [Verrucomicrobiota bacterium]
MASLWRHPNSNYWMACFTDINGRRLKRTTGVEVVPKIPKFKPAELRKQAQAIADEYEAAARAHRSANKVRAVLLDLHQMTGGTTATKSVSATVAEWLLRKKAVTGDSTMVAYTNGTGKFLTWLGSRAKNDLATISRQDIFDYRAHRAEGAHANTVNNDIKILRMLFREAKHEGWIPVNPAEGVDAVKVPKGTEMVRRPFTMPEIQALLTKANDEWKCLITCGLYTGQRLGDLARLKWESVDLDAGLIKLTTGKTGKHMTIPIAGPLRTALEAQKEVSGKEDYVHPKSAKRAASGIGGVSNLFGKILIKAGIREKPAKDKERQGNRRESQGPSFHCLRHTTVSLLKEAGIPQSVVMELIGHDSEQMSQHYTHTGEAALLAAVNALPQLGGSTVPPVPAPPTDAPS